jgi:pSer/pThr/pTyr-binding forkhead associated (FHA) protein
VGISKNSPVDLTSTIHLSQLRPVPSESHHQDLLEKLSPEERNIVQQLSPDSAMLIGLNGPGKGFRFLLNQGETTIGREVDKDISLDDVTVSRNHAVISRNDHVYVVSDSKSLNGTYVNAVAVNSSTLKYGDEIQIGKFRFVFFTGKVSS